MYRFRVPTVVTVAVLLLVGCQLGASSSSEPGDEPPASAAPSEAPASAEPSSSGDGSLPVGPHVLDPAHPIFGHLNEDRVIVTIPEPGWFAEPDGASVTKAPDPDSRVTVMAVYPDFFHVPRNSCYWDTNPEEGIGRGVESATQLVTYLSEQTHDTPEGSLTREYSTPVDITIDGYPGLSITSVGPMDPDSDPHDCDEQYIGPLPTSRSGARFCSLLDRDSWACLLSHLEPGALDTVWMVAGDTAAGREIRQVVAASYWPTTSPELLAEMNAIVESMTFTTD